ncbi:hypothetical protein [Rheinheimera sp. MMS21-TC3]|uniref:hypothetical protein n=1 Tax=Rheinheimera sp. MMS21-TC3 TaxID=3072790 RepID=UPI0028C43D70|nr:hypothetical protein [Rheinheimera sp. MMS21-TC3]WNO61317.1 hypothetical protein RDV63_10240 [Rheinheimera sp. MMS21-TC3]
MKHFIAITLLVTPLLAIADATTTEESCKVMDVTSISYIDNVQQVDDADVGAIYKAKTDKVLAFAKEHKLEDFSIISQDATVSGNCCGSYGIQVSTNYTITYKPSYAAFTALQKHSGSGMVSTYRVGMDSCQEK